MQLGDYKKSKAIYIECIVIVNFYFKRNLKFRFVS
jgi:hypothetical protein